MGWSIMHKPVPTFISLIVHLLCHGRHTVSKQEAHYDEGTHLLGPAIP